MRKYNSQRFYLDRFGKDSLNLISFSKFLNTYIEFNIEYCLILKLISEDRLSSHECINDSLFLDINDKSDLFYSYNIVRRKIEQRRDILKSDNPSLYFSVVEIYIQIITEDFNVKAFRNSIARDLLISYLRDPESDLTTAILQILIFESTILFNKWKKKITTLINKI